MMTAPEERSEANIPEHFAKHLTNEQGLARIVHDGQIYTLRITRMNKLILTK